MRGQITRVLEELNDEFFKGMGDLEIGAYKNMHQSVRGGAFYDWTSAPQPYRDFCKSHGYDADAETTWISYVDANSLYPTAMCMRLPVGNFTIMALHSEPGERLAQLQETMDHYDHETSEVGYFFEVTYIIPEGKHNHFDFAPLAKGLSTSASSRPTKKSSSSSST